MSLGENHSIFSREEPECHFAQLNWLVEECLFCFLPRGLEISNGGHLKAFILYGAIPNNVSKRDATPIRSLLHYQSVKYLFFNKSEDLYNCTCLSSSFKRMLNRISQLLSCCCISVEGTSGACTPCQSPTGMRQGTKLALWFVLKFRSLLYPLSLLLRGYTVLFQIRIFMSNS